ncbi:MAG: sodium:proton antiporter [Nitrospinae bacterium CG11_big_fil_rev_8_21_14_0_20_45_15]|nr:MAG: sodium:proton antiporter [Nitrospinae bacterium CG11_big_fil_rev_8_21_14_0_20_45_15]
MQTHHFFLLLLVILLTARIFAELAVRLKIPAVIGELLAGIVLGPSLLGWIQPFEAIKLMAEIGIILLLFKVGLETDPQKLVRAGTKSLVVALTGFVLPLILGFSVGYGVFGLSLLVSLFIGGTLTATSIGITARVLTDLKRDQTPEGQIILGAAILDDVMGVVLLALLYEFSIGGGVSLGNASKVILFLSTFFIAAPIAAKSMSAIIKHFNSTTEIPGLIPTMIVSLVLFFAWLAHILGAPEILGGFAAGLALSRRFVLPFGAALHADQSFAEHVEKEMEPIIYLFTPIFFVVVGLSLNLRQIDWSSSFIWIFSMTLMVVAIIGKLAGPWLIQESWNTRWIIGTAMIPRGEVGLIFAELGRESKILNNEIYAALVIVIAFTTLLSPLVMKKLCNRL